MRSVRVTASLIVLVAFLIALAFPASAMGVATYVPDAYEAGGGDNSQATARDITTDITTYGQAAYSEDHTFDVASQAPPAADEDWFRFTVTPTDIAGQFPYVFEAVANLERNMAPVIEIYGPGSSFTATPHTSLNPLQIDPNAIAGTMDSWWFHHNGAELVWRPTVPGEYFIRVAPYGDNVPSGGYYDLAGPYTFRAKVGSFSRVAGNDRISTAVAMSQEKYAPNELRHGSWLTAGGLVVVNGYDFPDALSAACLAGANQGPVLLTHQASLSGATAAEIVRLQPDFIYVVGGESVVSGNVVQQIESLYPAWNPVTVIRVSGNDRIATSVEVAKKSLNVADDPYPDGPGATPPGFVFIANAYNFPDALSAASMSAAEYVPILLTGPDALDGRVSQCIDDIGANDAIIVGGTSVVSTNVENQLISKLGASRVMRIAGADRYETSRDFAVWATDMGNFGVNVGTPGNPNALGAAHINRIGIARGDDFPDALAAGPFSVAGWSGGAKPILLTTSGSMSPWIYEGMSTLPGGKRSYWSEWGHWTPNNQFERSYIFGGSSAVSDQVFLSVDFLS